ncbi:hypothetical protein LTR94_012655 [Friedmanniomyces endolithicus]|nr:hypothetical protein LTR94_012655 [Friedmanniomyces endolithicus]
MQQKQANDAKQAQTTSDSFLTENAKKPGVKTTASGLQYKITQEGTGKQPTASSVVTVHYKGQLVDGKVFDSSLERGEPIEFPLNQVIPGWTEGLQLMKEGGKATLYIPSNLGYGPQGVPDLDLDAFVQGLREASKGQAASLSDEEMARVLTQYKRQAEAKQLLEVKQLADKNAKIGAAFLAENAKKPEVKTTASGLQYMVLQQGQGKSPKANSRVKVHYEGRLIDQTVFDSSIARQQPAEFQVSQVIQGWTEGLQLMKEGAKYRFFIPAKLGYGQIGSGDVIEPNSTLIFDVELIEVLPK